ncbi:coenzyme F420-0:L-glutamate ligase [Aromatoleum anaerobium]|uniref:Coenzyme F420-0:L-glutamate ligase n=1 Tax=Aromatoleum anaerobium TaxID=182180 RepID=A0ABX1PLD9_9RHOO|nr:coenzyme F420-0:L-glutamate ligase [Aromatoleum anaerobium]MCK0508179.1 coenzyme F420-0:L-glutamate ligase [Aromatoleum anaerobium]
MAAPLSFTAITGIPAIAAGDDLAPIIANAIEAAGLAVNEGDVLVVAQKIVSKAEDRFADLREVVPSARARELSQITGKDARVVELVLSESTVVLRAVPNVLIVRHRLGYVMANAGIDRSNVASADGEERVLLLPLDPDVSAERLRTGLHTLTGIAPGVIVSDSFGRPWRTGVVNVALGTAGVPSLIDRRGETDLYGRKLEITQVAFADALTAGAALVMGEGAEGTPAVLVRGAQHDAPLANAQALIRPFAEDLFQ